MIRVPHPRVSGLYFAERRVGDPRQGQYLGDDGNEITADTRGLTSYYLGNLHDAGMNWRHEAHFVEFEQYEKKNRRTP
jgi:hypothetical protein